MQHFIDCKQVGKKYGDKTALNNVNFQLEAGEIVGLIGPNGAGKSTLLKAIMGLIKYDGSLNVFGQTPFKDRSELLKKMSYIADVASLPGWMKVKDLINFVEQTHPEFDKSKAQAQLKDSPIQLQDKIEALSKGMKTRLHLAIILSINTELLILDEPTLGLDVMVRREFQDRLVQDYYNQNRSILITTHQVDEIESILTRVIFINQGEIAMDFKIDELKTKYRKLIVENDQPAPPANLQAIYTRSLPSKTEYVFAGADEKDLKKYGKVSAPSLEDLFVATSTSNELSANGGEA